jgi:hypothetical protein
MEIIVPQTASVVTEMEEAEQSILKKWESGSRGLCLVSSQMGMCEGRSNLEKVKR